MSLPVFILTHTLFWNSSLQSDSFGLISVAGDSLHRVGFLHTEIKQSHELHDAKRLQLHFFFLLHESFKPRHSLLAVAALSLTSSWALSTDAFPIKMVRLTSAWRTGRTSSDAITQSTRRTCRFCCRDGFCFTLSLEGKSFLCGSSRVWAGY